MREEVVLVAVAHEIQLAAPIQRQNLGPDEDSGSKVSASEAASAVSNMDKDSASALTSAVAALKDELRDHNKKIETLSDGVNKLVNGSVQKEIHKEISKILNKALDS